MAIKDFKPNPIAKVWGYLTEEVYQNGKQHQSFQDLQTAILRAWQGLLQKYLISVLGSMPNRCLKVIKGQGQTINI